MARVSDCPVYIYAIRGMNQILNRFIYEYRLMRILQVGSPMAEIPSIDYQETREFEFETRFEKFGLIPDRRCSKGLKSNNILQFLAV